jgi:hypothetical protein
MKLRPEQHGEVRKVRDALVSVGVCPECHWRFAERNRLYCRTCGLRYRDRARARIKYQGKKRCGNCRRKGHDRRNCRNKRTADLRD